MSDVRCQARFVTASRAGHCCFQQKDVFFLKKFAADIMQPIEQKILSRIYGRGRGWAFTKIDFVAEFGEANIHQPRSPDGALAESGAAKREAGESVTCSGDLDFAALHPGYGLQQLPGWRPT